MPVLSFGGVEKVVLAQARQFRAAGWRPHLFVIGARQAALPPEAVAPFESITLVHGLGEDGEDWTAGYFGEARRAWAIGRRRRTCSASWPACMRC